MLSARADQKVLGYLGRALSLEFSAVQLYSTQASLVASWGLEKEAAHFREEAVSELSHANRIIERMLANGVVPASSQLKPVALAKSLDDIIAIDMQFEQDLVVLYRSAFTHCTRNGDRENAQFFKALMDEEQVHFNELLEWQAQLQAGQA